MCHGRDGADGVHGPVDDLDAEHRDHAARRWGVSGYPRPGGDPQLADLVQPDGVRGPESTTVPTTATPLTIEDAEIDCRTPAARPSAKPTSPSRRVDIHGCENGLDMNQNITVEDSYIHDLYNSGDSHTDGIQMATGHWNGSSSCAARST